MGTKTGFFEESPGVRSITRVMFAMMIINGLFVMDYQLMHAQAIDIGSFIAIVGAACGLKLYQKSQETNAG